MAVDEIFPVADCCEICGIALGDEVVIQEFADGSLARLCPECAAGTNLDESSRPGSGQSRPRAGIWPDAPVESAGAGSAELDPLEKTKELLMPVSDLIALQGEMQSALERLAASLERFAAEMITESQGKNAAESRLQDLERELDKTRAQLSQTEAALDTAGPSGASETAPAVAATSAAPTLAGAVPLVPPPAEPVEPKAPPAAAEARPGGKGARKVPATGAPATAAAPAPAAAAAPAASGAPESEIRPDHLPTFRIEEVQAAQRYYNDSPFINRIRDVRRSLGKPKANVTRLPGAEPRALVTIAWDIVWYQYLINMRRDLPSTVDRVTLHREGMDLDELAFYFKDKNAVINDDGRLDASELEVRLLSDPSALITEMTPEQQRVFEDATEEVWDQRITPEFKWDD